MGMGVGMVLVLIANMLHAKGYTAETTYLALVAEAIATIATGYGLLAVARLQMHRGPAEKDSRQSSV